MPDASPTVRRRRLGQALRDLRTQAEISGDQAGAAVERSGSWISRLEAGRVGIRLVDLRLLLQLYGLTDPSRKEELEGLARQGQQRGWWSRYADALPESLLLYIGLEAEATSQCLYSNSVVPGILQVEDYSRATLRQGLLSADKRDPEIIEKRVKARMARQELLKRNEPPHLTAVLEESVLLRPIGGVDVFRRQLEYLVMAARLPFLDLRVLPFASSVRSFLVTSFTILSFEADPDIVYIETAAGGVYEHEEEVQLYKEIFQQLGQASLDAEASVAALRRAQERLTHEQPE
jgi:transcriptional regulator with XRE-family HTH domain